MTQQQLQQHEQQLQPVERQAALRAVLRLVSAISDVERNKSIIDSELTKQHETYLDEGNYPAAHVIEACLRLEPPKGE